MSIYFGSNKLGKIYIGNTPIGKIYKGSELVYQSGLQIFYINSNKSNALIYSWSTSGYYVTIPYSDKITTINGTLGSSGSSVNLQGSSDWVYNYSGNYHSIGGKKYYAYTYTNYISYYLFVEEGSKVGNYAILTMGTSLSHPTAVTNNSVTVNEGGTSRTYTRESNEVVKFTKENGFV